jgi:hypothetical protein
MKPKSVIKLFILAIIAAASLWSCSGKDNSEIRISDSDRQLIADAIRSEIASAPSIDSIANTPLVVSPSISMYNDSYSTQDTLRLVAVVTPFLFVIVVVWLVLYFKNKNLQAKYHVVELSVNRAQPLPEVFYTGAKGTTDALNRKRLFYGLVWIAFGVTGLIFFAAVNAEPGAALSVLPLLVGVAKVICYFVEQRTSRNNGCENTPSDKNL